MRVPFKGIQFRTGDAKLARSIVHGFHSHRPQGDDTPIKDDANVIAAEGSSQ
ncbi:MAG: hypothetical protein ACKO8Z_09335 [Prosthecobacter sp.]